MHPTIATELVAARHADLLRSAERERLARVARTARPSGRANLTALAAGTAQQVRTRAARLLAPGAPRPSVSEPCCA